MRRIPVILLLLLALLPLLFSKAQPSVALKPIQTTPQPKALEMVQEVKAAIQTAIQAQGEKALAFELFPTEIDHLEISADQVWSTAWLTPVDPETQQPLATEPGLAFAIQGQAGWQAILPSSPIWTIAVQQAPEDLLSSEEKATWLEMYAESDQPLAIETFSGYRLPFAGGTSLYLTRSIFHYNPPNPSGSMHHAFDFAAPHDESGTSPMFRVFAAKAGRVKYAVWQHPNGNESYPNYIVLEDPTTSPVSYQVYMHLAQESIPYELRQAGAPVQQGQFLGWADDTGISTGNHLHFQVHTNPDSYWGKSVDITFDDVDINGGRPRMPTEAKYYPEYGSLGRWTYTSGNNVTGDFTAPIGEISLPETSGFDLLTGTLKLEGWAADTDSGLYNAQFLAYYENEWHPIGEPYTSTEFKLDWDLCEDGVPDGPVSVALRLRDKAGNITLDPVGLKHMNKDYACTPPPPLCVPSADQVAVFADPNFQGACVTLKEGEYAGVNLGALGNDNAASIQVGANMRATLYAGSERSGRGETLPTSDRNLADNRIGADSLSSVLVEKKDAVPAFPRPVWPPNGGNSFAAGSSLSLLWEDSGGASQFQAELTGPEGTISSGWQEEPVWHLGSLTAGNYSWKVRAAAGSQQSAWSESSNFTVEAQLAASQTVHTAPYADNMEDGYNEWQNSNLWDQDDKSNHTADGQVSWWYGVDGTTSYATESANSGDLTSPPILVPSSGYYLRFWYLYETEGRYTNWDQRWVQLSTNEGPFQNILQFSDDPANVWLQSPAIDLSAYAGSTIRVRFHFETLDERLNDFQGWFLDDFRVDDTPPPECADGNNTPQTATEIKYGDSLQERICPGGDVDFYRFEGKAGDQVGIVATSDLSQHRLDTYLFLLDKDGRSILQENDDQIPYQRTDSNIAYRLPYSGAYYIKLRAWNHPSAGEVDSTYTIRLFNDSQRPTVDFDLPRMGSFLPHQPVTITVTTEDNLGESGISHVEFLWHSGDWTTGDWESLGEDWDGSDGWNTSFDPTDLADQIGIAFYVKAYDWAGNWRGAGIWNLAYTASPLNPIYLPTVYRR